MRFYLRKLVKISIIVICLSLLNALLKHSTSNWTFNNFKDRGKLRKGRTDRDNGRLVSVESGSELYLQTQTRISNQDLNLLRHQRGAKYDVLNNTLNKNDVINVLKLRGKRKPAKVGQDQQVVGNLDSDIFPVTRQPWTWDKRKKRVWENKSKFDPNRSSIYLDTLRPSELNDIFISVKTTERYHKTRIELILSTWYLLAKNLVYFFTDSDDPDLKERLGKNIVNTNCSADHGRRSLSCKMAVEFDFYMASRKRWFCHMDDDIYLNPHQLLSLLRDHDHRRDWYLGKPSLNYPLEISDRDHPGMKLAFWFATGGAGFCISRSLALKMAPHASGGRFMTTSEIIRLPDDCTIGYIVEYLLKKQLTVIPKFHSHLESLGQIKSNALRDQITFSFSDDVGGKVNRVNVEGFSLDQDPSRFRSLHCFLFPEVKECQQLSKML